MEIKKVERGSSLELRQTGNRYKFLSYAVFQRLEMHFRTPCI